MHLRNDLSSKPQPMTTSFPFSLFNWELQHVWTINQSAYGHNFSLYIYFCFEYKTRAVLISCLQIYRQTSATREIRTRMVDTHPRWAAITVMERGKKTKQTGASVRSHVPINEEMQSINQVTTHGKWCSCFAVHVCEWDLAITPGRWADLASCLQRREYLLFVPTAENTQ